MSKLLPRNIRRNSSILRYLDLVEELHLLGFADSPPAGHIYTPPFVEAIQLLAPHLLKLRSMRLQFHSRCFTAPLKPNFFTSLKRLEHVTELDLRDIYFLDILDFQRIVCSFSHLSHLSLIGVTIPAPEMWCKQHDLDLRLVSLQVQTCDQGLSLPWLLGMLLKTSCCRTIKSFDSLDYGIVSELPAVMNDWLQRLGENLENLTLPVSSEFDLSHNVGLRSLTLSLGVSQFGRAVSMLRTVTSARISELVLNLIIPSNFLWTWKDHNLLNDMDKTLAQSLFASLRNVAIRLHAKSNVKPESLAFIQRELDTCMRNVISGKILSVTRCPPCAIEAKVPRDPRRPAVCTKPQPVLAGVMRAHILVLAVGRRCARCRTAAVPASADHPVVVVWTVRNGALWGDDNSADGLKRVLARGELASPDCVEVCLHAKSMAVVPRNIYATAV
ncbi:hypothetical protein A0H81_07381 [Grifola frondosa]|uniref:Uncharacterized protein n=1 Tax=Grifola frondosa TaxID=5627 RepID=A0A1C7M6I3_GRIFR|nr:hypothetical protein A0H81_07381 [Grifola frondosa]